MIARILLVCGPILIVLALTETLIFWGMEGLGMKVPDANQANWATGTATFLPLAGLVMYLVGGAIFIWPSVRDFISKGD
jgi:hypothetical protein